MQTTHVVTLGEKQKCFLKEHVRLLIQLQDLEDRFMHTQEEGRKVWKGLGSSAR